MQSEPAGSTWDTVVADAKAQSTGAMSGGTPIYHSTKLEETTLEGDFTADADTTSLAIFSDDGCDVTIDGSVVWSSKDKGQALADLPNSLHKLSTTLNPGQTYHIKIDYSNTIYTGNADVDGCTLFAWGDDSPPSVTLTADDPGDPDTFQQVTSKVYAKVDHLPSGHLASDLTPIWTWYMEDTTHSDTVDGQFTTDGVVTSLFTITGDNADLTNPTATFQGEFDLDGFYEVSVRATVIYHDNRTGQNLGPYTSADTGDVYLGDTGDEPPPASPSVTSSAGTAATSASGRLQSSSTPKLVPKVKVAINPSVTLTSDKGNASMPLSASSAYPGFDSSLATAQITITAIKPNIDLSKVTLIVEGLHQFSNLKQWNYAPMSPGTIKKINDSTWSYQSFQEQQSDKHAVSVQVRIVAMMNGKPISTELHLAISSVFDSYAKSTRYGAAWTYVLWKYGISLGSNTNLSFDAGVTGYGRTVSPLFGTPFSQLEKLAFLGIPPDSLGENICASTILHENVHRYQSNALRTDDHKLYLSEQQAHQEEINKIGITAISGSYLQDAQDAAQHYADRVAHKTPTTPDGGDDPNQSNPITSSNGYYYTP